MDDKQALQAELYKILDKNSLVVTDTLAAKAITELITFIDAYTEQRVAEAEKKLCNYNCANCFTYNKLEAQLKASTNISKKGQ